MNKLYDIFNTAGRRGWICAPSEEEACDLALKDGWAKKRENLTAQESDFVGPDAAEGWDELVSGPPGSVGLQIPVIRGTDFFNPAGPPKTEKSRWVVREL